MVSLKKNIIYQSIYQLLISLLPLLVAPYISRVLGAENIGVYSYVNSIVGYFVFFAILGINYHGNRAIAAVRNDRENLCKAFSDLFCLHFIVSLFVVAAYLFFFLFISEEFQMYFAIKTFVVFAALLNINWFFFGMEQFKLIVARNAMIRITATISIFIFVKTADDLWIYVLIMSLCEFATQLVMWYFLKKFTSFTKPSWQGVKTHIKPVIVYFIAILAIGIYTTMDKIMLGSMSDKSQLGLYENSLKVIAILAGFIIAFNNVIISRMANIRQKYDVMQRPQYLLTMMKYVMLFSFALMFGIAVIANDFAPLFFGREFEDCGILISGLSVIIPLIAFHDIVSAQYLIPNQKDKSYTVAVVTGAFISIIANLLLIPKYGAMGVVIGRIIAESVVCIMKTSVARKALPIGAYIKSSFVFFITGILMFILVRVVSRLMSQSVLSLLIQISVGALFYLSISAGYLYITKDEFFMSNSRRVVKLLKR